METHYPFANAPAARMLAEGLARAKDEQGLSIRQIGQRMRYKTAVVLSHMALGRVPIPIDRAEELADILRIDKRAFLQAVFRQRHPDVSWGLLAEGGHSMGSDHLAQELEAALGSRLRDLNREQRAVMREVAAEQSPRRRWLSAHELHAVEVLRGIFPEMRAEGMSPNDLGAIQALFEKS